MTKRTRTRSGCLGCRSRKRKCDGGQPRCSHCRDRGEDCCYGVKASFHPSRALQLSNEDSAALAALETGCGHSRRSAIRFVDNTSQIVREYEGPFVTSSSELSGFEAHGLSISTGDPKSPTDRATGADLPATTLSPAFTPAPLESSAVESRNGSHVVVNASVASCSLHQAPDSVPLEYFDVELPVLKKEQSRLIREFLQETGTWSEVTDSGRHFTVLCIHSLMNNKPFAAAAMALASRQLHAVCGKPQENTLSLYQYAVQSLLYSEPSQCGEATLVCCVLLSLYEMMTHEADAAEWRRHLKGCVFNLMNKAWNGSSTALVGAAFWAFARIDVWASYLLEEKTLISTNDWVIDDDAASIATSGTLDDYCNLTTLLVAKVVNILAADSSHLEGSSALGDISALWLALQEWFTHRPRQIQPVIRDDPDGGCLFASILFPSDSSTCGQIMYHTGCMLLLQTGQVSHGSLDVEAKIRDPVWHARELCGISMTTISRAGQINQVFPLCIAGLTFSTGKGENGGEMHAAEKLILLNHLAKIERETGWPTSSKAAGLRKRWGLH